VVERKPQKKRKKAQNGILLLKLPVQHPSIEEEKKGTKWNPFVETYCSASIQFM